MEVILHSQANKTYFEKKGCALGLILKVRVFESVLGLSPSTAKEATNQSDKQIKTKNKPTIFRHHKTILDLRCHTFGSGK